jgi:hypothetical protein
MFRFYRYLEFLHYVIFVLLKNSFFSFSLFPYCCRIYVLGIEAILGGEALSLPLWSLKELSRRAYVSEIYVKFCIFWYPQTLPVYCKNFFNPMYSMTLSHDLYRSRMWTQAQEFLKFIFNIFAKQRTNFCLIFEIIPTLTHPELPVQCCGLGMFYTGSEIFLSWISDPDPSTM